MPSYSTKTVFFIFLIPVLLASCVNLRYIGEFSETSTEGIQQFDTLSPSFFEVCLQDCRQENIHKFDIHNTDCDCTMNEKADSITLLIYNTTREYFDGLSDLGNNELTAYRTDDFSQALTTGNFEPIKLNENDVKAYSDISTLLLRTFTDSFRRKKIKKYIIQAHEPLLTLLHFLELNLAGNLRGKLEVQKSGLKNFYFDFIKDKRLSDYERTKFAEDYFRRISEITAQQQSLETYALILQEIAKGHEILYDNVEQLSDKEVRIRLAGLGTQMKNTIFSLHRM